MAAVPIIIGVADVVNRSTKVEDAREPLDLIVEAVHSSIRDTGVAPRAADKLRSSINSIDVVATWTWPYPDLPGSIAKKLGIEVSHKHYTSHGGNQSGKIFDDAARRISQGKAKVAICAGGEALASCERPLDKAPSPG
jgi:acetyl-CoA acetyltransferase